MIKDVTTSHRLNFDRKMMGILSLFTILGVCLLIIILVISDTMSALRAYSTLQTHWTEKRKEATYLFIDYLNDPDEAKLDSFQESLKIIDAATRARVELFKENTNNEMVRKYLLNSRARPDDVNDMIVTFERFHTFPDFAKAIKAWIDSDHLVNEIRNLADLARAEYAEDPSEFAQQSEQYITKARALDMELTGLQYDLASALADGNNLLARMILLVSISLGVILLVIGATLSFRFTRSVKEWGRVIEINEQRYRSLFEHNPNAVFSMTTKGRIVDQNKAMRKMTGYSSEELSTMKAEQLVVPQQRETVKQLFNQVVQSQPQSFETKWKRVNGELLPLYLTFLPIYVDDEIVGVFGIADDISYIKHVEEQLKQQLDEKTMLLAEVHDRVKNNMALISSLLQLQEQLSDDETTQRGLESTKARIHSMAMVHERLYHVESFSNIRIDEYVRELVKSIHKNFGPELRDENSGNVIIEADPITLSIKRAIPCGLMLNEIITNAFKFVLNKNRENRLFIRLNRNQDEVQIQVKDNGNGLGEGFDINQQTSLGMILIRTLAKQLNGKLEVKSDGGTEFNIVFESKDKVKRIA